jgi:cellulose synthase/poly-beta-1,6-N-acetylglucosamine synthase-like glycosyltransferase
MIALLEVLANLWLLATNLLLFFAILGFFFQKKARKEKTEPHVSVIVAVWNEGKRLRLTLDSLLKQNYPRRKFEIIVSGGGDSETVGICREYQRKGLIRYIFERRRGGKWLALNKAVKIAKHDFIGFIDADCVAERDWLRKLVSEIGANDLLISKMNSVPSRTPLSKVYSIFMPASEHLVNNIGKFFRIPMFFGYGSLMKKDVLEKISFTKSVVEDWKFSFEMLKRNYKIAMSNDAYVYQHFPKSLANMRKPLLRVLEGFFKETIPKGDWFAFLLSFTLVETLIGLPLTVYFILSGNLVSTFFIAAAILQLVLFSLIVAVKEKNPCAFLAVILYFPLYLVCVIFSLEIVFRILLGKQFGWPIYEKG